MTSHNEWTLRLSDQLRRLPHQVRGKSWPSLIVCLSVGFIWWAIARLSQLHIFGNVDEYRTGAATASDLKGFMHDVRDFIGAMHQEIVLGDRLRDADDIGLLEGIAPDKVPRHLPGDCNHWDRVHKRGCQPGDQVGRAWTAGSHADADFAGGARVAIGCVSRSLLMSH